MAKVKRDYTLVLTIQVSTEEEENEIDHDWLHQALLELFPESQKKTTGRKVQARVSKRQLNRNY